MMKNCGCSDEVVEATKTEEDLLQQIWLLAEQLLDGVAVVHLAMISIIRSWVE